MADPSEGYGYEPPVPFGGAPAFDSAPSPFAMAPAEPVPVRVQREEPVATLRPEPVAQAPRPEPAPVAAAISAAMAAATVAESSSSEIRQLELRAIFGVDRELSADEILQRLRGLAGVRHVTRVGAEELGAMEILKRGLAGMAGEGKPLRLSFGNSPVDFIREGRTVLAVMTDGSFAPGVRETMIIAARELTRMA